MSSQYSFFTQVELKSFYSQKENGSNLLISYKKPNWEIICKAENSPRILPENDSATLV